MSYREIWEIVENGKFPVSKWISKNLDMKEKGRLDQRFLRIEKESSISPEWLKPYTSLKMMEIRFNPNSKAIRFLCEPNGPKLTMLIATQKNGNIEKSLEERACRLRDLIQSGEAGDRKYPNPFAAR